MAGNEDKAAWARRYRRTHPEVGARRKDLATARRRAVAELVNLHPAAFAALLEAQCQAMGIAPPGLGRPVGRPRRGRPQ